MKSIALWFTNFPLLPLVAFVSGFSLMVFELAAARVLAPSIGSSTYVWTSVIGVIIAALSLGYFVGGKWADSRHRLSDIAWLCLATAATITLTLLIYLPLIEWTVLSFADARWQGVVASLVLFAPTSFLIGTISPYLVKLKVTSLQTTGQSFASLSALESIGGITGTFITGFVLFGFIGARETFACVVALLVVTSWALAPRRQWQARTLTSVVIAAACSIALSSAQQGQIDTASAHYSIITGVMDNRQVVGIATGPNGTQSGVYADGSDELVFWYTQQMAEVVAAAPSHDRILVLGGGAFTLPQYLAKQYPRSQIDVVEIDPELAGIARQYFNYQDPANVSLIFDDARAYVNHTTKRYDVVLVDVYSDTGVPFSLITQEYGQQIAALLKKDGVVAANMIAGTTGVCSELLSALDAPYRAVLPHVSYAVPDADVLRSNMIITYSRQPFSWRGASVLERPVTPLYTDNFAPIERLQQQCQDIE